MTTGAGRPSSAGWQPYSQRPHRLASRFRRRRHPGSRITIPACAGPDRGATLSRSDSPWKERVPVVDLDQLVECGRARDDRHLRRRDLGLPRHGADHRGVGPPAGARLADHSCSVEPSHSRRSVRALAWTRTASRVRRSSGADRGAPAHGAERHRPPLLGGRRDVVLPLCPRRTGQDVYRAGLEGEFGRLPGACPAAGSSERCARPWARDGVAESCLTGFSFAWGFCDDGGYARAGETELGLSN